MVDTPLEHRDFTTAPHIGLPYVLLDTASGGERDRLLYLYQNFGSRVLASFFPDERIEDLAVMSYRSRFIDGAIPWLSNPAWFYESFGQQYQISSAEQQAGMVGYCASALFFRRFDAFFEAVSDFARLEQISEAERRRFVQEHFLTALGDLSQKYPDYSAAIKEGLAEKFGIKQEELVAVVESASISARIAAINEATAAPADEVDIVKRGWLNPGRITRFIEGVYGVRSADVPYLKEFGSKFYSIFASALIM
ncbi:hypothetical protein FJY90_04150 [Candidatus Gottesmanbacteria bacterium]|nr:hypothetical protein [Candidatus Gottesmanbacteria bacterium]